MKTCSTDKFVGSKGGSGIAQWIISAMPDHRTYIECCLGKGVILKTKLPASFNIGIEADPIVISRYWRRQPKSLRLILGDCLAMLPALQSECYAHGAIIGPETLIYCDPPYLGSSRIDKERSYYRKEMLTEQEHTSLLTMLQVMALETKCMVMISGYHSCLYESILSERMGWRVSKKWTVTRGGTRVEECLWMNFDPPALYHDSRFIGDDFTDRQAIKRKIGRWKRKFEAMPAGERFAVLEALQSVS